MRELLLGSLMASVACGPSFDPGAAAARAAIVGGAPAPLDRDVYFLFIEDPGNTRACTATQIGRRTLLTAAHCLADVTSTAKLSADPAQVPGNRAQRVVEFRLHPQWSPTTIANDFALVLLEHQSPEPARAWASTRPSSLLKGAQARVAGYGLRLTSGGSETVERHSAWVTVNQVTATHIDSGDGMASICSGDSGGPLFFRGDDGIERVVGVHSSTSTMCRSGKSSHTELAREFIEAWLSEKADRDPCAFDGTCSPLCSTDPDCACADDGACAASCPHPLADPDCSRHCVTDGYCAQGCGVPDVDCDGLGRACSEASQCPAALCTSDAQNGSYCTVRCGGDGDCQGDMRCSAEGVCLRPQLPTVEPGYECRPGQNRCVAGFVCTGLEPGAPAACQKQCATAYDCTLGTSCEPADDGQRFCRPPVPVESPRRCSTTGASLSLGLLAALLGRSSLSGRSRRRKGLGPKRSAPPGCG